MIERESRARFDMPVREHHLLLRLSPWEDDMQRLHTCKLTVEPAAEPASHLDGFGNRVHRFAVMAAHDGLITRLHAEVETLLANPFDFAPVAPSREWEWIEQSLRMAPRLWDFVVHRSPFTPALPETIVDARIPAYDAAASLLAQVQNTMGWIQDFCELDPDCTKPQPELSSLFTNRCGSPADLAHLLIAIVRGWGIPARYVTGYLDSSYFEPDDEHGEDTEPRQQTTHSWAEVLIPGANWRGFDPSTGLVADSTYIRVAVGRDAGDVMTERTVYKGGNPDPETHVSLNVSRLD